MDGAVTVIDATGWRLLSPEVYLPPCISSMDDCTNCAPAAMIVEQLDECSQVPRSYSLRKLIFLVFAIAILSIAVFMPKAGWKPILGLTSLGQWTCVQRVGAQSGGGNTSALQATTWRFDQIESLGGHPVTAVGHPHLIDSPYGKAVEFNGVDDALFVGVHPLAGASSFTWEVIFMPDADGAAAQRFFHLQEVDPKTGEDTQNRMLFEIRIVDGQWCLDSFATSNGTGKTLLNCKMLHPLGKWYRVTAVYDGKTFSNYVEDELEGSGEVQLAPQGMGRPSIGTRINKTYYFKGAVLMARMTPRALSPDQFLKATPSTH